MRFIRSAVQSKKSDRPILAILILLFICCACGESSDTPLDGDHEASVDGDGELDTQEADSESVENADDDMENDVEKPYPDYPLDDTLRLNQIQVKGTHNSYHIFNDDPIPVFGGALAPLDVQLEDQGVRQFELDVHYDPDCGFRVYHTTYGDAGSNCETLGICLALLKTWSDAHPGHHALFIFIEPKDDFTPLTMTDQLDALDDLILSVWPAERLIRPDDLRGDHATLRAAIEADGWPTLGESRDKAVFFNFDSDVYRNAYLEGRPNAEGRVMFPRSDKTIDSPIGAFVNFDDPQADAERIRQFAEAGFLIRTRTDVSSREAIANDTTRISAALASAAQLISTDFPAVTDEYDYFFDIPEGNPSRCHPLLAPAECTPADVENLAGE